MATIFQTWDMKGIKEDFADWISNISPEATPFTSMIQKFPVTNTQFQWQVDTLKAPDGNNAFLEGSDAADIVLTPTDTERNYTQIMRTVVMVSDTADAVDAYGRGKESFYQLKKAAKSLKLDTEAVFLQSAQEGKAASAGVAGLTSSLGFMIEAGFHVGAANDGSDLEEVLFGLTRKMYQEGAEPEVLMYNPSVAKLIAAFQEKTGSRMRIFENTKEFVKQVEYIVDPLGQELKCIPNRLCPPGVIYILNMDEVGMAVLRPPVQTELSKTGSHSKWMIEQEVGLRLNNPKAAAMITVAGA